MAPAAVVKPTAQAAVAFVKVKPPAQDLQIRGLNITVFDPAVRSNLIHFNTLPVGSRGGQQEYDFIKRAYKAAVSAQLKAPKLSTFDFEKQKSAVSTLLTAVAGLAPVGDVALEWKKLPKNAVLPPKTVTPGVAATFVDKPVATHGELTAAEIEAVLDGATKQNLKDFLATAGQNRRSERVHTLIRKAILRS